MIVTIYIQSVILYKVSNLSPASLLIFLLGWLGKQKNTHILVVKFNKVVKLNGALQDSKSTAYLKKNLDKASIMQCKKLYTRHLFLYEKLQTPSAD